jgi:hypothetical protein
MSEDTQPAAAGGPNLNVENGVPAIEAAIDRWFNDHIAGSPVAQSVEAYNHLRSALGALSAAISAIKEI